MTAKGRCWSHPIASRRRPGDVWAARSVSSKALSISAARSRSCSPAPPTASWRGGSGAASSAGAERPRTRGPNYPSTARGGCGGDARWAISRGCCRGAERAGPGQRTRSADRAKKPQRVRQTLGRGLEALAQFGHPVQIGEAALDKGVGLDAARRAVVEPEQHRGAVDRGEAGALCVEAEIGRIVANRVPDAVDRLV